MNNHFNVVFMGTPDFAVPCLDALNEYGCNVKLVVTQTDKPSGRGRKLSPPPVKSVALKFGYPVSQPQSVRTEVFYKELETLAPDLLVVVAFGHILPKKILEIPRYGAINVHASLLPKYRGPAPIQWAIINGETETGVTTMLMDKGLDTGEILLSKKCPIYPDDTAQTLHDRLSAESADILKGTLKGFENQTIRPIPQQHALATYAPMLSKEDGHIDWALPAVKIERFVRGMSPWPGAFTFYNDKRLKIFSTKVLAMNVTEKPGTVVRRLPEELLVTTGEEVLKIIEVQGASGKRMDSSAFLRGSLIPPGAVFS